MNAPTTFLHAKLHTAAVPDTRLAKLRLATRLIAEADEILTRTSRIVNRLCPMPHLPSVNSSAPEAQGTRDAWQAYSEASRKRNALHKAIKPRVAAKVRGL